jgi:hypothetical protein
MTPIVVESLTAFGRGCFDDTNVRRFFRSSRGVDESASLVCGRSTCVASSFTGDGGVVCRGAVANIISEAKRPT